MEKLTIEEARRLNDTMVTEEHLKLHDYEKYPEEHLAHTEQPLRDAGVPEDDIRAILSHGYTICTDVRPETALEKSLFTVD